MERYLKITLWTIGIVVFLVLVGGIVRSTGSGMGCPDWPKCFGMWVPPTCACDVPEHYIVEYGKLGLKFNAVQTWIEYVNRLIGALTGLFIFATLLASYPLRKVNTWIPILSFLGFILVGIEGWLGKKVVDSNLHEGMITLHMFFAMILLAVLIIAYLIARPYQNENAEKDSSFSLPNSWILGGLGVSLLILVQIIIGTQVRENVDVVAKTLGDAKRGEWIANLGEIYFWHKNSYYLIVLGIGYWLYQMKEYLVTHSFLQKLAIACGSLLSLEILFGISMNYFAIPPFLQPLHLLFATVLFMGTFAMTVVLWQDKNNLS
ncbi:MAG: COX15/CtaA family protein [Bacteroidia bacterium]